MENWNIETIAKNVSGKFRRQLRPLWNGIQKHHEKNKYVQILQEYLKRSQPAFVCLRLTIETLEQDVKYVQS